MASRAKMILTVNSDFELWKLWLNAECRKVQRKHKLETGSAELELVMKDVLLMNIDETISVHLVHAFKDDRKTFKTLLEAIEGKHRQLSRPADIQKAFQEVKLYSPCDSFKVAQELKRLSYYVNGGREFLIQHFIDSIQDYDFKLLIQQKITSAERDTNIDELANFLSQMPPKITTSCAAAATSSRSGSDIWATRKCYNCGTTGHGARWCRAPKSKCDKCNRWGHSTQFCNQKN